MRIRSSRPALVGVALAVSVAALVAAVAPAAVGATGDEADSSVTVKWAGGNDRAIQQYQPDHAALTSDGQGGDAGSGHWDDFKNLSVTVSKTKNLGSEAILVTAEGGKPTTRLNGTEGATSYLQMFQCWGYPGSADFAKTCQWGGYSNEETGGSPQQSVLRIIGDGDFNLTRGGLRFLTVTGRENEDKSVAVGPTLFRSNGLADFFDASSSNERIIVPFGGDGRARTAFVTQTAIDQPYLGCGAPEAAGERCWLVIVPRGTHSGTRQGATTVCSGSTRYGNNNYGDVNQYAQVGSPIDPNCSMWDDRIVVPLDFDNPYRTCAAGTAERRLVGSEFIADAIASWQSTLCDGADGAAFSLITNSGDLARSQLLQRQAGGVVVVDPLTPETIGTADSTLLADADIRYAPIANTAVTIGYLAETADGTQFPTLRLTPRLIAKMLTQSFRNAVPKGEGGSYPPVGDSRATLRHETVVEDEEWAALGNPTNLIPAVVQDPWVVTGPAGDDGVRALWRYVLADADARAYLAGEPDPWGNTVNPYYLPPGASGVAGPGIDLLTAPIDTFPKVDLSVAPDDVTALSQLRGMQIDSLSYNPYSLTLKANASRIVNADQRLTNVWDPQKFSGTNVGFFVPQAPQLPASGGGRLILGPTAASGADRYQLATAELALPLDDTTDRSTVASAREFVPATETAVARAVAAQTVGAANVPQVDPAEVPSGAYPLALTVYGAFDVTAGVGDQAAREDYATFIDYAGGAGNVPGEAGGLPAGYVPLTAGQVALGASVAAELRDPTLPSPPSTGGASAPPAATPPGSSAAAGGSTVGAATAATATTISTADTSAVEATAEAAPPAQGAVGGALAAGLVGAIAAPFLLRRRPT